MENIKNAGYYSRFNIPVQSRNKDITSKELLEVKEKKEFRQAIVTVGIFFAVITLFAIFAKTGNVYI